MDKNIAHATDLSPGNFWMENPKLLRYRTNCLTYYFKMVNNPNSYQLIPLNRIPTIFGELEDICNSLLNIK